MDMNEAVTAYGALSTPSRVRVLQLLAKAGPRGVPSGEIALELGVPTNSMSSQLLLLSNARLVTAVRDGRSIIYSINPDTIKSLVGFLINDCAGGKLKGVKING